MKNAIKICGVTTTETFDCALKAGATHAGFVFFAKSPRAIIPQDAAAIAGRSTSISAVALTVDASDGELDTILSRFRPDLLQMHGHETPQRIAEIRTRTGLPVIKAVTLATPSDMDTARTFETVADILLFDAPPSELPGGNGIAFDWTLLAGRHWKKPWLLSGGLTPENVADAIYQTRPTGVDVSSGVEWTRGVKDNARVTAFITSARTAFGAIAQG